MKLDDAYLEQEGHIHSVETCGTVDGPGIRYILFTSGCPLRCQYCHNPDAQGKPCGDIKTVRTLIAEIMRYKNFLRGGGLTISGGEPLMQPEFVDAMFRAAKAEGLHTTLDTSGYLGAKASDSMLENIDLILLDIKSFDPEIYREVTSTPVEPTLRFAQRLSEMGKPVWIRFVLVPGLTDIPENVEGLAEFVSTLKNVERVEILPFHKMGEYKYEQLNIPYRLLQTQSPTLEQIDAVRAIFAKHGVETL